jgi:fatty acid amide hydrolase 2
VKPITERSAIDLARAIRRRELSARDVLEAHIDVLRRANPALNAVVVGRIDRARGEADAADERIAAAGPAERLPPLLGVPCTIKESIAVAGMTNTGGVVARAGITARTSAPVAQRVLDAGAIHLGATNTSELCLWIETENRVYGRTNNAYDPNRTAGGSSGGEGAAVGSGISPFGLGSDLTGSIRIPAFHNGVFGHKPSTGLVPTTGAWPPCHGVTARMMVNGPLTRRAEDIMPLLQIIAGPDGTDPVAQELILGDPDEVDLERLRIVLPTDAFVPGIARALVDARERAADALAAAGARIERLPMRNLRRTLELTLAALSHDVGITAAAILRGEGAEPLGLRGYVRCNSPHTVATRLTVLGETLAAAVPKRRVTQALAQQQALNAELADVIGDGVMLYPPLKDTAPRHGRTVGRPWWIAPMAPFNLAGLPVTQVPLGLGRSGLPLGVQVAAGHGRDHATIAVALELERAFGGWTPPNYAS